jgi:hypothetical protein
LIIREQGADLEGANLVTDLVEDLVIRENEANSEGAVTVAHMILSADGADPHGMVMICHMILTEDGADPYGDVTVAVLAELIANTVLRKTMTEVTREVEVAKLVLGVVHGGACPGPEGEIGMMRDQDRIIRKA